MSRRFQVNIGGFPPETTLIGVSVLALLGGLFGVGGPLTTACLIELAGAAFGTALGINTKRPWLATLVGAALVFPLAKIMYELVGASGA